MANICIYKVKVCGRKLACYKLIHMMPLYTSDKEILYEDGDDDNYTLIFNGDTKWGVDCYTKKIKNLKPFTQEELEKIEDGDGWEYCLSDKSILLDCEIFCNSKDIDSSSYASYVHYNKGEQIKDECPKELHIKRGRDYDCFGDVVYDIENKTVSTFDKDGKPLEHIYKVRFEDGYSYWYLGQDYEVGDFVNVEGAKEKFLGVVKEKANYGTQAACYFITKKLGTMKGKYISKDIEDIWNSYKPKDRKEYLKNIGLDETMVKKKFLSVMENKWMHFSKDGGTWEEFINTIK